MIKEKTILTILILVLLVCLTPRVALADDVIDSGSCGDNITWTLTGSSTNMTLTISGTGEMYDYSESSIPWASKRSKIKRIVVENGVTSIGSYSFYSLNFLNDVTITDTVNAIGGYTFANCVKLVNITIPDSVTSIGEYAFQGCNNLKRVDILDLAAWVSIDFSWGSNPCEAGNAALYLNGIEVTQAIIPDGVTSIGERAFEGCNNLTNITIPDSMTSIGDYAFNGCNNIKRVDITDLVAWVSIYFSRGSNPCAAGNAALYLNGIEVTQAIIPDGVTSIGEYAFAGCSNLTSVTIPDSVTSIGQYAFDECNNLKRVDITDLAAWVSIDFCWPSNPCTYGGAALYLNGNMLTQAVIPEGVTSIGEDAFAGCSSLTSVTLPDSVTSIGERAFAGCSNLASIILPDSVKIICQYAFSGCSSLTDITLPKSSRQVDSCAFEGCSSLKSLTIPYGVTSIEKDILSKCCSLESITFLGNIVPLYLDDNITTLTLSFISDNYHGAYNYNDGDLELNIKLLDGSSRINDYAFSGCSSLTSITIPDGVKEIGKDAFEGCNNLKRVDITDLAAWVSIDLDWDLYSDPSNPCEPGNAAIYLNGVELANIAIPDGVTNIGQYAFAGCSSLTSVTIPDSVTSIGERAFEGCNNLTNITIPDSMTSIGDYAFNGCNNIKRVDITDLVAWVSIDFSLGSNPCAAGNAALYLNGIEVTQAIIPDGVTSIGEYAFAGCSNLTSVTIPDSVTSIGQYAFEECNNLKRVDITDLAAWVSIDFCWPSNPCTYGGAALYLNGNMLTQAVIPEGVTSIGEDAFAGCSSLTSVIIPEGVKNIGDYAFEGCNNLTNVTILDSVTSIGEHAFYNCNNIKRVDITDLAAWVSIDFSWGSNPCEAGNAALYLNGIEMTQAIIPDGVTNIGQYAFAGCSSLTSVTIPDSVTSIGQYAFDECNNLKRVDITDLAAWVSIDFSWGSNPCEAGNAALYLNGIEMTQAIIPDGVASIGERAFAGCSNLTSITIPDGVTSIGDYAFAGCSRLKSMVIPSSIKTIGENVFFDCNSLQTIYYRGSQNEWDKLFGYEFFSQAQIYYDYFSEDVVVDYPVEELIYSGSEIEPVFTIKSKTETLVEGEDYSVSYSNNINAGKATAVISGEGNYSGSMEVEFTIRPRDIKEVLIEDIDSEVYSGSPFVPKPKVTINNGKEDIALVEGKDFTFEYKDNTNVGTAKIIINGKGNYTGIIEKSFNIEPFSINNVAISEVDEQVYSGKQVVPELSLTIDTKELILNKDYTLLYKNNTNVGHAVITIEGIGNYSGTVDTYYNIVARSIYNSTVTGIKPYTYTGNPIEPEIIVTCDSISLVKDKDYTVLYNDNTDIGTALVIITGKGNYTGTISIEFAIVESSEVMADKKAANETTDAITTLKTVDSVTLADKDAIIAARTAYDELTDVQKALVPAETLKKLTDAEAKLLELEKADTVTRSIASLKGTDAVTLADKEDVVTARAAYDKLTDTQKKLVSAAALKKLTDVETKIAALEKEAAEANKTPLEAVITVVKGKTYTVNKLKYKVTNADMTGKGTVTLFGTTTKKTKLKKLTIPTTVKINGAAFKVTAIGNNAFKKFTRLTKVTIGKNVTKIGKNAFSGDKKLKTITIKSSKLKSVGKNAIKGIQKKAKIKVPKKQLKKYKKLFKAKTGFKKTMKIKK